MKLLNKAASVLSVVFLVIVLVIASVMYFPLFGESTETEPFYVGVTYGGESVEEAKILIDRVKSYSNLFVLMSGGLMGNSSEGVEIFDYAVASGMYCMQSCSNDGRYLDQRWLEYFEKRWGDQFLGVYYGDEMGGKMMDGFINYPLTDEGCFITKYSDGKVSLRESRSSNNFTSFFTDGMIRTYEQCQENVTYTSYYPNGTVICENRVYKLEEGIVLENNTVYYSLDSYENLLQKHPFLDYDKAAETFVSCHQNSLNVFENRTSKTFTSDYVLHWFDYKAGYDVIFAQLGWNHTLEQDIALVRGAAHLQNKSWGTIITWKYKSPPYLDSGEAVYEQMCMSYECGAQYVVLFNYAEEMHGPYGTLQDEHFQAMERFWSEVVHSSAVKRGSVDATVALVLPRNYGWGMRTPEDKIWGLWGPDEKSPQIWQLSRILIEQYGYTLDIIYDDPEFPVANKYSIIFYWSYTDWLLTKSD